MSSRDEIIELLESHKLPILKIDDLSEEQVAEVASILGDNSCHEWLEHQRQMLKIKIAAFLISVPFAVLIIEVICSLIGFKAPPEWVIEIITGLMGTAITQLGATVLTIRKEQAEKIKEHETEKIIKIKRETLSIGEVE